MLGKGDGLGWTGADPRRQHHGNGAPQKHRGRGGELPCRKTQSRSSARSRTSPHPKPKAASKAMVPGAARLRLLREWPRQRHGKPDRSPRLVRRRLRDHGYLAPLGTLPHRGRQRRGRPARSLKLRARASPIMCSMQGHCRAGPAHARRRSVRWALIGDGPRTVKMSSAWASTP